MNLLFGAPTQFSPRPQFSPFSFGGFSPQPSFQTGFNPSFAGPVALPGFQQLLLQLAGALTQLAQGWQGLLGGGGQSQGYPGAQSPTFGNPQTQPFPGGQSLGPPQSSLAWPSDSADFASYLQAQRIGGTLEGKTGIAQKDAIPGSRFARVADPTMWNANVARNYAFQFSAYAHGADALTVQGLSSGAYNFDSMSPDAKLFTQVASVFKGNLFNGPGFYDNPGLKRLLESKGLGELASRDGVGQTDVQTIGAVTIALNSGRLTLNDVLNSGTIDNMQRYQQIIGYVSSGGFRQDLANYDSVAI